MKIDTSKILTALIISALVGLAGAVWDFQNVKADVSRQDAKLDALYDQVNVGLKDLKEDIREVKRDVKRILGRGGRDHQ